MTELERQIPKLMFVHMLSGLVVLVNFKASYMKTIDFRGKLPRLIWELMKLSLNGKINVVRFVW